MYNRFIGDVHGKFAQYIDIVNSTSYPTIQVGDYGAGFVPLPTEDQIDFEKDWFIRGNHDDPAVCSNTRNWLSDGLWDGEIFFVGGARSTDIHLRVKDESWWEDEEITNERFYEIADNYERVKPNIVVTHDGPEPIIDYIKGYADHNKTRTQQALTSLLYLHRPKLWVFGHYHRPFDEVIDGCRFICLAELEHIDIDTTRYL